MQAFVMHAVFTTIAFCEEMHAGSRLIPMSPRPTCILANISINYGREDDSYIWNLPGQCIAYVSLHFGTMALPAFNN